MGLESELSVIEVFFRGAERLLKGSSLHEFLVHYLVGENGLKLFPVLIIVVLFPELYVVDLNF